MKCLLFIPFLSVLFTLRHQGGLAEKGSTIVRFLRLMKDLDIYVGVMIFFSLIALMFVQVCSRMLFNMPIQGADELSKYFFIFCVYISLAYVDRTMGQVQLDLIVDMLPRLVRAFLNASRYICTTLVFAVVAYSSVLMLLGSLKNKTPALGIPYLYFMLPTVVGLVLITLQRIFLPLCLYIAKRRPEDNGQ